MKYLSFSNFSLETFIPNLVSVTCSSPWILAEPQIGLFSVSRFLVKSFIYKNYHNSRTNNDINMKLGLLTTMKKINMAQTKKKKKKRSKAQELWAVCRDPATVPKIFLKNNVLGQKLMQFSLGKNKLHKFYLYIMYSSGWLCLLFLKWLPLTSSV